MFYVLVVGFLSLVCVCIAVDVMNVVILLCGLSLALTINSMNLTCMLLIVSICFPHGFDTCNFPP